MKHLPTLLSHEIRVLLVSPSTYIAAVLFLGVMGFIFAGVLDSYSSMPQETPPATVFFQLFFLPVFFMVPLLTMKSISEERRHGTLETLLTTPVTTAEVVLGKFGAAYFLYLTMWASTGGFFWLLHRFADGQMNLDPAPMIGGYCFIAVSGLLFIAVGVFASALSRNQAVAGLLAFAVLLGLVVGMRYASTLTLLELEWLSPVRTAVDYGQVFTHLEDFSRGIIDARQVLYYLSGTSLALILSVLVIEAKLLHS